MYLSTDGADGIPLIVMACVALIYYFVGESTRKTLQSIWWWFCPAFFGVWSLINYGDLWGAIKTGVVAMFWVGIPGGIMLSYLANRNHEEISSQIRKPNDSEGVSIKKSEAQLASDRQQQEHINGFWIATLITIILGGWLIYSRLSS